MKVGWQVFNQDGSSLSFLFADGFYANFLPHGDPNSTVAAPAPAGFVDATLQPHGDGMVLVVGGLCAYR